MLTTETNQKNTYGNDDPVCPYCGHIQTDVWYEISKREDGHQEDMNCQSCERTFSLILNIVPTFTTNCIDTQHETVTDGKYRDIAGAPHRYIECRNCEYREWCTDEESKKFISCEVVKSFEL